MIHLRRETETGFTTIMVITMTTITNRLQLHNILTVVTVLTLSRFLIAGHAPSSCMLFWQYQFVFLFPGRILRLLSPCCGDT